MGKAIMTRCAASKFRIKQGMNDKRAQRQANRILRYGVTHREATGEIKKFMDYMYFHCHSNNTRLYGDTAYLFDRNVIISQYRIPDSLMPDVKRMNKDKRELIDGKENHIEKKKELHIPDRKISGMTPLPWQR